jgi:hypothetical protein
MKVVDEQLKSKSKVALFYGAGHNADFHKRLLERGFKVATTSWEKAWNMSDRKMTPQEAQMQQMMRVMKILEKIQNIQRQQQLQQQLQRVQEEEQ